VKKGFAIGVAIAAGIVAVLFLRWKTVPLPRAAADRTPNIRDVISATPAVAKPDETSSPSATAPVDRKKREETIWQLGLTTPIRFYGKVIDES